MEFGQFILSENSTKTATRKLAPGSFVFAKNKHILY